MTEMISVYRLGETWFEIGPNGFSNETGGYPPGWCESASEAERLVAHAARIALPGTPAGKVYLGYSIAAEDGVPVAQVQFRDMTDEDVAASRSQCVVQIKTEARRRIVAIMNEDQQRNALARGQEMIYTHGPDPSGWPSEEQAEYAAIMSAWGQIKAIRAASDSIEAALPSDDVGLAEFDAATAEGWPA